MKTRIGIISIAALVSVSALAAEPANRAYEVQFLKNNKSISSAMITTVGDEETPLSSLTAVSYAEKCDDSSSGMRIIPGVIRVGNTVTLKPQADSDWVELKWSMSELLKLESVVSGKCQVQKPIVEGTRAGNAAAIAVGDVFTSGHGNYGVSVKRIK